MNYTPKNIFRIPQFVGVYLFKNKKKQVIYIGKTINLKKRVSSYFQKNWSLDQKTKSLVSNISTIKIIPVKSELEALFLEAKLINLCKPKYNVIWRDDKKYIYIRITKEIYPKIIISPKNIVSGEKLYGPFSSKRTVLNILSSIRRVIPFCSQNKLSKKSCFYTHLNLCNPCPCDIEKEKGIKKTNLTKKYRDNIAQIRKIFSGNIYKIKKLLLAQMVDLSNLQKYEQASRIRDKLRQLEKLEQLKFFSEGYIYDNDMAITSWRDEQKELLNTLKPYFKNITKSSRIESYDISNISGELATGSLVTFINGQPEKKYYRHFRIRTVKGSNDVAMLKEILLRRLKHSQWPLPDLLLVDGGKAQLITFLTILKNNRINIPVISLAKKSETVFLYRKKIFIEINLAKNSSVLQLIQRLRDEAHRFAYKYHQKIRLKSLFQ